MLSRSCLGGPAIGGPGWLGTWRYGADRGLHVWMGGHCERDSQLFLGRMTFLPFRWIKAKAATIPLREHGTVNPRFIGVLHSSVGVLHTVMQLAKPSWIMVQGLGQLLSSTSAVRVLSYLGIALESCATGGPGGSAGIAVRYSLVDRYVDWGKKPRSFGSLRYVAHLPIAKGLPRIWIRPNSGRL